jgi:uroporphyrinogen decarboxylase
MDKRSVVQAVFNGEAPPYVPWSIGFTGEANDHLREASGCENISELLQNHMEGAPSCEQWADLGEGHWRDPFGVVWDRSKDKDIGVIVGQRVDPARLDDYEFPAPTSLHDHDAITAWCASHQDVWRVGGFGFSLYERAWTLVGMEELMCLMLEEPEQVHELLDRICEHNLARLELFIDTDIDAVYFGDDWGDQRGLQMGKELWNAFIRPRLARMYGRVKEAGKRVMIHSCGKVDECFSDLVDLGLDCFNPFQPEVMNVGSLVGKWRGNGLCFHGGLSTQKTLPYGSVEDVRAESEGLIRLGGQGGYIFSPAHAVEGDVPGANMLCFLECCQAQAGYQGPKPACALHA